MPTDPASELSALQADKNADATDESAEVAAGESTTAALDAAEILRDQAMAGDQDEGALS